MPYKDAVLADTPSLYLRLGELAGTDAFDGSGNGLTGGYQGAPTLGVPGAIAGDPNLAVALNGSTQYITVADNALLDPGNTFTLELWLKLAGTPAGGAFYYVVDKGANSYAILVDSARTVYFRRTSGANIANFTANLVVGTWYHIVVTKTGSDLHMYRNGIDLTSAVSDLTIAANASDLNIGRTVAGASYLNASVDDLAIYPTALSAARVLAHFRAGRSVAATSGRGRFRSNRRNTLMMMRLV